MGYNFPTFLSPEEKARQAARVAANKAAQAIRPKGRARHTQRISSASRRSWKKDELGFDRPEHIDA